MLISAKSRVRAIQHSRPGENQSVMQEASGRRRERGSEVFSGWKETEQIWEEEPRITL